MSEAVRAHEHIADFGDRAILRIDRQESLLIADTGALRAIFWEVELRRLEIEDTSVDGFVERVESDHVTALAIPWKRQRRVSDGIHGQLAIQQVSGNGKF